MKNKLLVTLCAAVAVSLAFTSCKPKSDVTDVCGDMVKTSMHSSPRSLLLLNGETLTIKEFDFASSSVNDNRIIFREISFGNGTEQSKTVLNLTYSYGAWNDNNTGYSLTFNPATPYASAWYRANAFITPDGLTFGGDGNNVARVEKWEKTLSSFPNTDWTATFMDEISYDSVFQYKYDTTYLPPTFIDFVIDTIKKFDSLKIRNADTTCTYDYVFNRDSSTYANSCHLKRTGVRSKYNAETGKPDTINLDVKDFDYTWFFSSVSSDSKFKITLVDDQDKEQSEVLDISKYKYDVKYVEDTTTMTIDTIVTHEFLLNGLMFKRPKH